MNQNSEDSPMSTGFYIRKLYLSSPTKKLTSIEFKTGLNVIAGASNTGKTFIYQSIDFMLGGKNGPKPIPECEGYDKVIMEISQYDGVCYTLERPIQGGVFRIKEGDLNGNGTWNTYAERLSDNPLNIATFLLNLCNLDSVQLRKNKNNEKVRLSFRDVAGLCMADEKRIITEDSPVHQSEQSTAKTKEQSLFYYLLSGSDATNYISIEDPKVFKTKIAGKIEFIQELIKEAQEKLNAYAEQDQDSLSKSLEEEFEKLNFEYKTTIQDIDKLKNDRAKLLKNGEKLETSILFKKELLTRFNLLQSHYKTDSDRLKFISEGSFLLGQLTDSNCPICGSPINGEHNDHLNQFLTKNKAFERSIEAELHKINLKQTELLETIATLKTEVETQNKSLVKLNLRIAEIDKDLSSSLTPISVTLRERLKTLSNKKVEFERFKQLKSEITHYSNQINRLNALASTKQADNDSTADDVVLWINSFCSVVEDTLQSWAFPNLKTVTFDSRFTAFDILINNNPRATNGKGYRAITFSAFIYSLMRYCDTHHRNHPHFLILDSPLTTFKESDNVIDSEVLDSSIEHAFFTSLVSVPHTQQVIILENKEPDDSLIGRMNYIHFTGQTGSGRCGFFEQ